MSGKRSDFSFKNVVEKEIDNEIQKWNKEKVCQETNILVKLIKENLDIISVFIYNNFINSLFCTYFHSEFKKCKCDKKGNTILMWKTIAQ